CEDERDATLQYLVRPCRFSEFARSPDRTLFEWCGSGGWHLHRRTDSQNRPGRPLVLPRRSRRSSQVLLRNGDRTENTAVSALGADAASHADPESTMGFLVHCARRRPAGFGGRATTAHT